MKLAVLWIAARVAAKLVVCRKERYDKLGGKMILEVVKGGGHNMAAAWFHNQKLVDFIIQYATASK